MFDKVHSDPEDDPSVQETVMMGQKVQTVPKPTQRRRRNVPKGICAIKIEISGTNNA